MHSHIQTNSSFPLYTKLKCILSDDAAEVRSKRGEVTQADDWMKNQII